MQLDGRFGDYGGAFVPQILLPALEQAVVEGNADYSN